jgi:predicted RND superfamily exporter protein
MYNTPPSWVPTTNEQRRTFDWFNERFEGKSIVIVSWPECTVDHPGLEKLENQLTAASDPAVQMRNTLLFAKVLTGRSAMREMMAEPLSLSREQALQRLRGSLVGPDREVSCALIVLTEQGALERRQALQIITETAVAASGCDDQHIFLAGSPVGSTTIDVTATRTLYYLALPSALISLLVCWICLRSWRYSLVIFAVAAFGACLVLAAVYFMGQPMNAVLVLMPPLVFVLTIAGGIHLVNYYYDELRSGPLQGAVRRAVAGGWQPCVLAALTTAIGMSSLLVSEVLPIRMFGGLSALGVMITVLLLLLVLPGAMEMWPRKMVSQPRRVSRWPARWLSFADVVTRRFVPISLVAISCMVVLGCGLKTVRTSVQMRDLFARHSRIVQQYAWLEKHIGPMVPVEVVVHFNPDCQLEFIDRMELVQKVATEVEGTGEVDGVVCAATFAPPIPKAGGVRQTIRRKVVAKRLARDRQRFMNAKYLYEDAQGDQAWRISARVSALGKSDCGLLLDKLQDQIDPLMQEQGWNEARGVHMTYTGAVPLVCQTQRLLLRDLFFSFLTAFAIVAVVMMIVLRNVWAGLVAMVPNLFPALTVFGVMGWFDIPVDIGSVMTASVALGIAVVDTLHFLTWYRREISLGHSSGFAVRSAFRHCATAMAQTSLICGVGILVFVASPFVPVSRFAWMVAVLLGAALVGDLLILPALLVGPLGRVFARRSAAAAC